MSTICGHPVASWDSHRLCVSCRSTNIVDRPLHLQHEPFCGLKTNPCAICKRWTKTEWESFDSLAKSRTRKQRHKSKIVFVSKKVPKLVPPQSGQKEHLDKGGSHPGSNSFSAATKPGNASDKQVKQNQGVDGSTSKNEAALMGAIESDFTLVLKTPTSVVSDNSSDIRRNRDNGIPESLVVADSSSGSSSHLQTGDNGGPESLVIAGTLEIRDARMSGTPGCWNA